MELKQNVQNMLLQRINEFPRKELETRLSKIRIPCMDYLKKNTLQIFKDKIKEVYAINYFRTDIIDLPKFLEAVKIIDRGPWAFDIVINEHDLQYYTAEGEPIYQINSKKDWQQTREEVVHNLEEYWRTPIQGQREDKYYIQQTQKSIDSFIQTDFLKYVKKLVKGGN